MTSNSVTILRRSARRGIERARAQSAAILDVTSKGPQPWVRFSPFFPHLDIPVPLSPGWTGASVEGIWQALKVFEHEDADLSKLSITSMQNLKRSMGKRGRILGHRAGIHSGELLDYVQARSKIYLPSYRWVLEHHLADEMDAMRRLLTEGPLVLLDYETNAELGNTSSPLSHAALVRAYLLNTWPSEEAAGAPDQVPSQLEFPGLANN